LLQNYQRKLIIALDNNNFKTKEKIFNIDLYADILICNAIHYWNFGYYFLNIKKLNIF